MTDALTLFDQPTVTGRHRRNDPETAVTAAGANGNARRTQQQRVAESLRCDGPATDYELSLRLGIPRHVVAKRRAEVGAEWTGERRPTDTGCQALVWGAS